MLQGSDTERVVREYPTKQTDTWEPLRPPNRGVHLERQCPRPRAGRDFVLPTSSASSVSVTALLSYTELLTCHSWRNHTASVPMSRRRRSWGLALPLLRLNRRVQNLTSPWGPSPGSSMSHTSPLTLSPHRPLLTPWTVLRIHCSSVLCPFICLDTGPSLDAISFFL